MNKLALIALASLFGFNCLAANECRDADGNVIDQAQCANNPAAGAGALPEDALAQVNELKVKMRYFKAIGFHKQSKEQRDAIAAIYQQHNMPLPDEYKE